MLNELLKILAALCFVRQNSFIMLPQEFEYFEILGRLMHPFVYSEKTISLVISYKSLPQKISINFPSTFNLMREGLKKKFYVQTSFFNNQIGEKYL